MICPKCKANLNNGSEYCPRCGLYFENKTNDLLDYYLLESSPISLHSISIWYLLFGGIYAIYKKMYYIALNTFLVDIFAFSFNSLFLSFFIADNTFIYKFIRSLAVLFAVIIHVYYVFHFNKEYLENRNIKINKIKRDNSDESNDVVLKLIEKDSKNNTLGLLISIIILFIFIYISFIMGY